ncbi:ABC transporter ATP-binding protein [Shinella pollutisoli]|uniref:ABC transporter ATP-binding protein n=1 Tax=Shinella pollutisoli TaxID=2250594 RepID=A0ABV7DG07_9HYPH
MSQPIIDSRSISKNYGSFRALTDISLTIRKGEFIALVGPSGCGKTSFLKILAGFEQASSGELFIEDREMSDVPAAARPTRMVFQKLALFPHKTVEENISFPLRIAKVPAAERAERVRGMMDLMHLRHEYLTHYPAQLSGGEQQRVALARALVSRPGVLLLDEPMSALDAKLKKSLQAELKKLHRELGTSFVLVTHDLEEAMMLADRICVMVGGRIVQLGVPLDIYRRPANRFVAGFIGETNFLPVSVASTADGLSVRPLRGDQTAALLGADRVSPEAHGDAGLLLIRPEDGEILSGAPSPGMWTIAGTVDEKFTKGSSTQYRIRTEALDVPFVLESSGFDTAHIPVGAPVSVGFHPAKSYLLGDRP